MRTLLLFCSLMILVSCQKNSSTESEKANSQPGEVAIKPDTLCFQQILKRDTTTLQLKIDGPTASGYLDNNPYEKDRARGPIEGTVAGNQIRATWSRSGEGITERYAITFTLKGDAIVWREGERVQKQGIWVLKEPARGYEYVLNKTDCK
ncbi:hypothetical protein WBJ53_21785 [Spirosoma sp. SC4-14]|uniref:hypothetical protein n=1 Tax=Spirosoma sp. SC4-14 TaxID=3128900 RepID=UPI0030CBFA77